MTFRLLTMALMTATMLLVGVSRPWCAGTTLITTWRWSLVASLSGMISAIVTAVHPASDAGAGLAWYGSAILALCAPVSVLGARRPGVQVWGWFVVLPLIAVLGWPAAVALASHQTLQPLQLEAPPMIGIAFVLVMGCGNFIGTRFGWSAFLFAVGECALVFPATRWASRWSVAPEEFHAAGASLWFLAAATAGLASHSSRRADQGIDRLWSDFRNAFGIVWAHRLQERANAEAARERWPARLTPAGIAWLPEADESARRRTLPRVEHTLRWLLRRFVDDAWIDERMPTESSRGEIASGN